MTGRSEAGALRFHAEGFFSLYPVLRLYVANYAKARHNGALLIVLILITTPVFCTEIPENSRIKDIYKQDKVHSFAPKYLAFDSFFEIVGGYGSNVNGSNTSFTLSDVDLVSENFNVAMPYFLFNIDTELYARTDLKNAFHVSANFFQRANTRSENMNFSSSNAQAVWFYRHRYAEQSFGVSVNKTNIQTHDERYRGALNFGLRFRLLYGADLRLKGSIAGNKTTGSTSNQKRIETMFEANLYKKMNYYLRALDMSVFVGESIPQQAKSGVGKKLVGGLVRLEKAWGVNSPVFFRLSSSILAFNFDVEQQKTARQDTLFSVNLLAMRHFGKAWEVAIQLTFLKNKSNIEQYEYSRMNSGVSLKRF
ncbi:MAG TPA: hypothetical protein ENK06_13800, partial [Gammaproteobacteria bacterium]|nr:hypothetical protein [Gammaproteobacteria bacterium]